MPEKKKKRRFVKPVLLGLLVLAAVIQLVPYGRDHSNPPVTGEPQWDSATTRDLAKRTCYDCHSNETDWPWYSNVAPVSWLVQRDVDEGRSKLNFSEWDRKQKHADEAAEEVRDGEMPLWIYLPTHPEARLTEAEKQQLITGLEATFGKEAKGGEDNE
ncbi:MAG: heme-binding domain-containing protein [Planctomycetota bacterium]